MPQVIVQERSDVLNYGFNFPPAIGGYTVTFAPGTAELTDYVVLPPAPQAFGSAFEIPVDNEFEGAETFFIFANRAGFATLSYEIVIYDQPFTILNDTIDFNKLSSDQITALNTRLPINAVALTTHGFAGDLTLETDIYHAREGNDKVWLPNIAAYSQINWISTTQFRAGPGNDTVFGGDGADNIHGGEDNDTLVGGKGNDTLDGASGVNTIDYSLDGGTQGIKVNLNGLEPTSENLAPDTAIDTFGDTDSVPNIRNVIGTGFSDVITGGTHANHLSGGEQSDTLIGGEQSDTLQGGAGNDYLFGDSWEDETWIVGTTSRGSALKIDEDVALFSGPFANYKISELTGGYLKVSGPDGTDILRDIEYLKFSDGEVAAPARKTERVDEAAAEAFADTILASLPVELTPLVSEGGDKWAKLPGSNATELTYSFALLESAFSNHYFDSWSTFFAKDSLLFASQISQSNLFKNDVREIFGVIESFANIKFTEVSEDAGEVGTIRFLGFAELPALVWGVTENLTNVRKDNPARAGDIVLSNDLLGNLDYFGQGNLAYHIVAHEIGHALGLPDLVPDPGTQLPSIMSQGSDQREFLHKGFQPSDVKALQTLYSTNQPSAATSYAFFDFSHSAETIWNPNGVEVLDFSNVREHQVSMDLREGLTSDLLKDGMITTSVGIAFGTVVLNAEGGDLGDNITGNASDNRLTGNGGNDTIDGGEGSHDVAVYLGPRGDYEVRLDSDGWKVKDLRESHPDGDADELTAVEFIEFAGSKYALNSFNFPNPAGTVEDGFVKGATVFADSNGNGTLELGEATAVTNPSGSFTLVGGTGPLIAYGGTDSATGLGIRGQLRAPENSTVVTPLTTVIELLGAPDTAELSLLASLGIGSSVDLTNFDPIAATLAGDAIGAAVFAAGAKVYDAVILASSVISGAGEISNEKAIEVVFRAIAQEVSGGSLNLGSSTNLESLIYAAAMLAQVTITPALSRGSAAVIAAANNIVDEVATRQTGTALLADISAIERVAQGAAAEALKGAGTTPTKIDGVVRDFTGDALQAAIYLAQSETGDVDGPAVQNTPVARADVYTVSAGASLAIDAHGVLANDRDADGDTLVVSAVSGGNGSGTLGQSLAGLYGTLILNADGSLTYEADDAMVGPTGRHLHDLFAYTAADGNGGSATGDIDIAVNRTTTGVNDLAGVETGRKLSVAAAVGVLANELDPDGDTQHVSTVNGAAANVGKTIAGKLGTLQLNSDGSYTYAAKTGALPANQKLGFDEFTYTADDGHGGTAAASLTITVMRPGQTFQAGSPSQTLMGGNGSDVLDGSLGRQILKAGNGADVLIAGSDDVMTGGNGPDLFIFRNFSSGSATITDFALNVDHLQLDFGVQVASMTSGSFGVDLHLSNGADIILQTLSKIPDWHVLL